MLAITLDMVKSKDLLTIALKKDQNDILGKISEGSLHDKVHFLFLIAYVVGQEANRYANDEDGPEDVKTLQNHQEAVEKVVAEEGFVDGHWVNPRTVNNP